jgi:mRNA interferase MazF
VPSRGQIVLARFPFTDGTGTKLRPLLVLAEIPGAYRDVLVMFITSQLGQAAQGLDVVLTQSHPAFDSSGLKTPSVFRIAKVASISDRVVVGTLGYLNAAVFPGCHSSPGESARSWAAAQLRWGGWPTERLVRHSTAAEGVDRHREGGRSEQGVVARSLTAVFRTHP